jgi:tRNA A37 threonylcarbamoyladenosine modification protein TsaB
MNIGPQEKRSSKALLLIDTTIVGVTVGIVRCDQSFSSQSKDAQPYLAAHEGHYDNAGSIALISTLTERCLREASLHPNDVQGIVISTGPGSFTGIKIGLAFAQGWACGLEHTTLWLGVSALEHAVNFRGREGCLTLFLPATRTHGFVVERHSGSTKSARLIDISSWDKNICRFAHDPLELSASNNIEIVGTWPLLEKILQDHGSNFRTQSPKDVARDAVQSMADHAAMKWPKAFSPTIPGPNYLRLSTAEEQLAQRAAVVRRPEETQ